MLWKCFEIYYFLITRSTRIIISWYSIVVLKSGSFFIFEPSYSIALFFISAGVRCHIPKDDTSSLRLVLEDNPWRILAIPSWVRHSSSLNVLWICSLLFPSNEKSSFCCFISRKEINDYFHLAHVGVSGKVYCLPVFISSTAVRDITFCFEQFLFDCILYGIMRFWYYFCEGFGGLARLFREGAQALNYNILQSILFN